MYIHILVDRAMWRMDIGFLTLNILWPLQSLSPYTGSTLFGCNRHVDDGPCIYLYIHYMHIYIIYMYVHAHIE